MTFDVVMAAQVVAFGAFLWLGFFILSRALNQTAVTILTFIGLTAQACFFASSVIIDHPSSLNVDLLVRLFWWSNCLPMAIWFHMTTMVTRRNRQNRIFSFPVIVIYTLAFIFILLGTFTSTIINYDNGRDSGPGYPLFVLYLAVIGFGALWNLWHTFERTRRKQIAGPDTQAIMRELRMVVPGGVLFLVGGLYLAIVNMLNLRGYNAPGAVCALIGLALLGYGLVSYDMVAEGRDVRRDFLYALCGMVAVNIAYVVPLALIGAITQFSVLVIVALATLTHSTVDFWRARLDTLFFSLAEREARSAARSYATDLGSLPTSSADLTAAILEPSPEIAGETAEDVAANLDAEATAEPESDSFVSTDDEKNFNDLVRRAITGLKSQPQMVRSPLLGLKIVEQRLRAQGLVDNRLNRAAILREILLEMIESLRPAGQDDATPDALRFYNVLYYPYVRAISHKAALGEAARLREERRRRGEREPSQNESILNWLADVDENTFYKWQRKASDTIASTLREAELQTRGVTQTGERTATAV